MLTVQVNSNEYLRIHEYLRKQYGKASKCENPKCLNKNQKRFEWALKKGKEYSYDKDNYMQMCISCHRKYDYSEYQRKALSKRKKGTKASEKTKIALRAGIEIRKRPTDQFTLEGEFIKKWSSATEASRSLGMCQTSISNCLNNRSKTAGGFKWEYHKN